jgi:phosphoribosyl 1,2-cyclic phosphodiesterase
VEFSVLASGSKANSVFIRSGRTAVLLDCGLSRRETIKRLSGLSVQPEELAAIVVSHEHEDHISGIRVFAKQSGLPVYLNEPTFSASRKLQEVSLHQIYFFQEGVPFMIGELRFFPFLLSHDAAQPVGFRVSDGERSLSVVTDLGVYDDFILDQVSDSDALLLESNHETEQLWLSEYPWELKERIAGSYGHLSNDDASRFIHKLVKRNAHGRLKFIGAGHVSENSNTYDRALQAIKDSWRSAPHVPHFFVANQKESTEFFQL